MLKIGEFSKLAHLTVKALRFYEKEGLLIPDSTDEWTGYRYYETSQLATAAKIKAYRQLGLSIKEIQAIFAGEDAREILHAKRVALKQQKAEIELALSVINHILEEQEMKYQVTEKVIPAAIVYYSEKRLESYGDIMTYIPAMGAEAKRLNPDLKCAEPPYEFCEYLDEDYREKDILVRHSEAVEDFGQENDIIKFREIPETKVIGIFHKGAYENLGEAYAFIIKYAEENGYKCAGTIRECYIDGIWNKNSVEDWLTEIQMPVE